jgi:transglutaminase-like putative cysteine protease
VVGVSWRIEVRHVTGYRYPQDVLASYNEARMTPLTTLGQLSLDARLEITPAVRAVPYWDYWGSLVHAFDIHAPHRELVVTATSVVETPASHDPVDAPSVSWSTLAGQDVERRFSEYLAPTAAAAADAALSEVAAGIRAVAATPRDALDLVVTCVRDHLAYEKGSTSVSTSAVEAWRAGRGVCQDFAHLSLAILRALGVPGRYVSGYFHPEPDAPIGESVVGDSHAWFEAWTGDWHPVDPTNTVPVGERHVLVARGRDYRDVTPLKGVYSGAPSSTPTVTVELTRRA